MNNKELILIMDNLPVGILRFDKDKTFIYANKFVINLCGSGNKCNNTLKKMMDLIHPDYKKEEMEICKNFLEKREECQSTFRIFNKGLNEYRWVTNKRTFIKNKEIFMYTIQDINEIKLLEIKLRNETIKAEEAYNHKSIFLSKNHHNLRIIPS